MLGVCSVWSRGIGWIRLKKQFLLFSAYGGKKRSFLLRWIRVQEKVRIFGIFGRDYPVCYVWEEYFGCLIPSECGTKRISRFNDIRIWLLSNELYRLHRPHSPSPFSISCLPPSPLLRCQSNAIRYATSTFHPFELSQQQMQQVVLTFHCKHGGLLVRSSQLPSRIMT